VALLPFLKVTGWEGMPEGMQCTKLENILLKTTNKDVVSSSIARQEFMLPYLNPLEKFIFTEDPCVFEDMK
jgi:hypothetical protein